MPAKSPAVLDFLSRRQSQSAKLFTDPIPSRQELEMILTSALRVPDHGKLQPWRLIVVQGDDFKRLADLAEARAHERGEAADMVEKARGQFDRGRLAVVVISSPKAGKHPIAEQVLSAGALCLNIVTVATAAGWGANWLSGWPSHDPLFIARAFGCTEGESIAGIVHIATAPQDIPDRPRPDLAKVVQWGLA